MNLFCGRFKELRLECCLSIDHLAEVTFTTVNKLSKYERGEVYPSEKDIEKYSSFFGVEPDYLKGTSNIRNKTSLTKVSAELKALFPKTFEERQCY